MQNKFSFLSKIKLIQKSNKNKPGTIYSDEVLVMLASMVRVAVDLLNLKLFQCLCWNLEICNLNDKKNKKLFPCLYRMFDHFLKNDLK